MSSDLLMSMAAVLALVITCSAWADTFASHPPQRPLPTAHDRPLGDGPAYYVHPLEGDDRGDGSKARPWRTINHALARLAPGDTLVLRGGTYYQQVYCAVAGTPDKPIVIRSAPGEIAIIDAGIAEFQTDPASAWQPAPDGVEGEYVSAATYKNIRDVSARFGDSLVGLQTYWYRMDLQSSNEKWLPNEQTFIEPLWCGPGVFYDKQTGRIHARLAHTRLELPPEVNHVVEQYRGETDPRKLPLIIAPFNAKALHVDQGMHLRFQDLVFRGGGLTTVHLNFGVDLVFEGCTIYAGNYGLWSKGTGPLEMAHCGIFGGIAPWMFRDENVSYAYSPKIYPPFLGSVAAPEIAGKGTLEKRVVRHISRMPTHAVLVTEGGFEFETFYTPLNHDWNVHHCEFTDGHDGVYLSGRDIDFHHNLVDNMQDDAIYVSSPTPYITDGLYIHQNLVRQCVAGFGGHARGGPGGKIYIFRNVVDMRRKLQFSRPSAKNPKGNLFPGHTAWLVHNPDHIIHMEHIYFYHNTTMTQVGHSLGAYTAGMAFHFFPGAERRVFNNLCVFVGGAKAYPKAFGYQRPEANLVVDGTLHWHADPAVAVPDADAYYKSSREHPLSAANKQHYAEGWDAHSRVGDPKFVSFSPDPLAHVDLRLQEQSPAVDAGVAVPEAWPDPVRSADAGLPDIGAVPLGSDALKVGIGGRTTAGQSR